MKQLRTLMEFNRWANLRLLDAVAGLTPAELTGNMNSSFPSVLDTALHIYQAEWIWLSRCRSETITNVPGEDTRPSLESLREEWDALWASQLAFLDDDAAAHVDRLVRFRLRSGVEREQALGELIRHVVNHGTYHRGQLVTLLRQLGKTPPSTDYTLYLRESGA